MTQSPHPLPDSSRAPGWPPADDGAGMEREQGMRAGLPDAGETDRRRVMNGWMLAAGDALALSLISTAALQRGGMQEGLLLWQLVFMATWLLSSLSLKIYPGYGLDGPQRLKRLGISTLAALPSVMGAALVAAQTPSATTPGAVVAGLLLCVPAVLLSQALVRAALRRAGLWGVDVAIIGEGEVATALKHTLERHWSLGYRPTNSPHARLGIIAIPNIPFAMRDQLIDGPLAHFRQVLVIISQPASDTRWAGSRQLGPFSVLEACRQHLEPTDLAYKRVVDLLAVLISLPVLLPVLAVISLLIKLDSRGPVLYGAERLGWYGRNFTCWKFRTMHQDAEAKLVELLAGDEQARAHYAKYHKLPDDPRVTRIGRLLRRSSLDELPQLLNVLRGEMSLVGPRPYLPREIGVMNGHKDVILSCRPGLTGLWQVSGRNQTSFEGRLQLDVQYVRRWSPWMDFSLLLATVPAVVQREGAS